MKIEKIFKGLILSQPIIGVFMVFLEFLFPSPQIPSELQLKYLQLIAEAEYGFLVFFCIFILIFILFVLFSWNLWKLYKFKEKGIKSFLIINILGLLLLFTAGNIVITPWNYILNDVYCIITGFILSMAYFSTLKDRFS